MAGDKITLAEFKARYPEFDGNVPDATLQMCIDDAFDTLSPAAWGDCYAKAQALYAAHCAAISKARTDAAAGGNFTGGIGKVQSSSVGGASISFQQYTVADGDQWFSLTTYGQEYLNYRAECINARQLTGSGGSRLVISGVTNGSGII
jgi:hypothetical protein